MASEQVPRGRKRRSRVVLTGYCTSRGVQRRIRLYECWINLRGRLRGGKTAERKRNYWAGTENGFASWAQFRAWALSTGYRKGVELDRKDASKGYFPDNLQWLTKKEHTQKSNKSHMGGCPCVGCRYKR